MSGGGRVQVAANSVGAVNKTAHRLNSTLAAESHERDDLVEAGDSGWLTAIERRDVTSDQAPKAGLQQSGGDVRQVFAEVGAPLRVLEVEWEQVAQTCPDRFGGASATVWRADDELARAARRIEACENAS